MTMGLFERLVRGRLGRIREGRLTVGGETHGNGEGPAATIEVHDPRFWRALALGGAVGAGESYMDGLWDTDDLTAVVRILVRNREAMQGLERGSARVIQPFRSLLHFLRRNTKAGSRRNIAAHYDLGNDFFELLLDETMTYSCAYFETPDQSLRDAQVAKYDRLCRRLDLRPDDHLLEIGTGWGGMALHAAREFGCRVTTTTISERQHEVAARRVREAGLEDRVELLLRDYRELEGRYDKLVSIEMIEAVGHHFLGTYFETCAALLKPGGRFALQAIVIRDEFYESARREVDFIKRYVFPGCCIPSVEVLQRHCPLPQADFEDLGLHYARTLRLWDENMRRHARRIRGLGYSEQFLRMWHFYLCYCEGGFLERHISDVHMVFAQEPASAQASVPSAAEPSGAAS